MENIAGPSNSASSNQNQRPTEATKRLRLPNEGYDILRACRLKNPNPSMEQRHEILAQIKQLPNTDWYTLDKISRWFQQYNHHRPKKELKPLATGGSRGPTGHVKHFFPQLSTADIRALNQWLDRNPSPGAHAMDIVAKRLGLASKDVYDWVALERDARRTEKSPISADRERSPHLPTPESTASPEPSRGSVDTPTNPTGASPQAKRIAATLNAALSRPPPPTISPTTPAEFAASFEPHVQRMESFIQRVQNGEFSSIGLDASCIPPE